MKTALTKMLNTSWRVVLVSGTIKLRIILIFNYSNLKSVIGFVLT